MIRFARLSALTLVATAVFVSRLQAGSEIEHLEIGDVIPAGEVRADTGEAVGLRDLVAEKPTVLIFYRGGWCPYCNRHLAALAEIAPELEAAGYQLLAISPDRPEKLREKPDLGRLPYTLYSDSSMDLCESFGIAFKLDDALVVKYRDRYGIDLEGDSGETHHLLPHPSVFIVDGKGLIRFAHVDPNYKVRLDPETILKQAQAVLGDGS
jgi:peroxiredoxin